MEDEKLSVFLKYSTASIFVRKEMSQKLEFKQEPRFYICQGTYYYGIWAITLSSSVCKYNSLSLAILLSSSFTKHYMPANVMANAIAMQYI